MQRRPLYYYRIRHLPFPIFKLVWNEMKWNEKPIVPWRAKASSFEGQLNVYACDELFVGIAGYIFFKSKERELGMLLHLEKSL